METILEIEGLTKTYRGGFTALDGVDLSIRKGEIFALLGPNGAGKTTLIGAVCGLVQPTAGTIRVFGEDMKSNWRDLRRRIGLVPQELATDMFETVLHTVNYSRGLFGHAPDPARIEEILRALSLWDKRKEPIRALSGGMKRRVLIAKALAHDPDLLFLDEPTAGVDVELRRQLWELVTEMNREGVTIVLTTHYLEEAEELCDRIAIINHGELIANKPTRELVGMAREKILLLTLDKDVATLPEHLGFIKCRKLGEAGLEITYDKDKANAGEILSALSAQGLGVIDVTTREADLEDVFVSLTAKEATPA